MESQPSEWVNHLQIDVLFTSRRRSLRWETLDGSPNLKIVWFQVLWTFSCCFLFIQPTKLCYRFLEHTAYSINLWITLYVDSVVKKTRDESGLVKLVTSSEQWLLNPKRRTAWYRLVKNGFPTPMNQWMMIVPNEARIGSYNLHIINHNTLCLMAKTPNMSVELWFNSNSATRAWFNCSISHLICRPQYACEVKLVSPSWNWDI